MTKKKEDRAITAADLVAELAADFEYRRAEERRHEEQNQLIEQARRAADPLLAELRSIGIFVESVGDLYDQGLEYRSAMPLLAKWLPRIENIDVKQDIVRALTVPWARSEPGVAQLLIQEFDRTDHDGLRWAIGNALEVLAGDEEFDAIARLANDCHAGEARQMVTLALGNMSDRRRDTVLRELLAEETVAGHAVMAIGKARATDLESDVRPFLDHPKAWIRKEARKTLAILSGS